MTIHERIKEDMKAAMKARDEVKLTALRGLLSAFTNELVAQKKKPDESVSDDMALTVIARGVKQRKDSIEQFGKGGRADLVANEEAELAVLQAYLPTQMSKDEIRAKAEAKKAELGITDKKETGKLTGMLMKELKGRADGAAVKEVVDELFA